ncbi:MAG: VWA domain-containing protein [Candidatus Acidiferrales bacterium]|jgi:VWFA-related protein
MFIKARLSLFIFPFLLCSAAISARHQGPENQPGSGRIVLDVVVTPKSGQPVSGFHQQDFTLLNNKVPQPLASFQAVDGRQAQAEVILLVDAVNTGYQSVAFERGEIDKFLRVDRGNLAHPTALAVLTDTGIQTQEGFSNDGNALSASLDQYTVGLRNIRRDTGFYGAAERFQLSLKGLHDLAAREASHPGRTIIVWISPGWPLLSGANVELDTKQQQQLFGDVVSLSKQLQQARITLYSVDPLGTADTGIHTSYWKSFTKGISKPSQVHAGDLGLEVLATQSGGLALSSNNDVAAELQKCVADAASYYEISFNPPPGDQPNEYHRLEIRVAKPGMTARTRQGYYSQP